MAKLKIDLKRLTGKQLVAWRMRYRYGWRLREIALELGISKGSACGLIQRAHVKAGLAKSLRVRIMRTKPRRVRAISLSTVNNY